MRPAGWANGFLHYTEGTQWPRHPDKHSTHIKPLPPAQPSLHTAIRHWVSDEARFKPRDGENLKKGTEISCSPNTKRFPTGVHCLLGFFSKCLVSVLYSFKGKAAQRQKGKDFPVKFWIFIAFIVVYSTLHYTWLDELSKVGVFFQLEI